MAMDPRGEFEVIYVPSQGLDFSRPYNTLDKEYLAPGTVNTQSINGFLCSSPWVANAPFSTAFAAGEIVIGQFVWVFQQSLGAYNALATIIYVTDIGVYVSVWPDPDNGNPKTQPTLTLVHAWALGELNTNFLSQGNCISFIEMQTGPLAGNNVTSVYFTGMMLRGVFVVSLGVGFTFTTATTYVCGRYITELGQRLVIGEAMFPTGGGPFGYTPSPTIAWSGVGSFIGAGVNDPWNPANFGTLAGNVGGFNLLTDVPDQITGLATIGRSAYIARTVGITQQDPGPSGIDPFIWYHMWASPQGVGAYNNTFQQYGQTVVFVSDDNVYLLSLQGGISPIGDRIIPKILQDVRALGMKLELLENWARVGAAIGPWLFGSIVNISGQLHYLVSINTYSCTPGNDFTATSYMYDLNINEGSWHFWDFGQYQQVGGAGAGFMVLSSPVLDAYERFSFQGPSLNPLNVTAKTKYLLLGGVTTILDPNTGGTATTSQIFHLVPLDYDVNTNPYSAYWANVFHAVSVPATTIKFRGEQVQLGHKINMRRLRLQSMNAPFPAAVVNYQGQITVTLTGSTQTPQTSPVVNVNVDAKMGTYYGDVRLGDEMIQASISPVLTGGTPWLNLPLFRLSTVSIIGSDTKGSTG